MIKTPLKTLRQISLCVIACVWVQVQAYADDQKPEFTLAWPVDCTLDQTCWIARYPDKYASETASDYMCGFRTQEGHDGTDIALADLSALDQDVPVRAAADGFVWRVRDGVEDRVLKPGEEKSVSKIGCGNVVIMQHPGGWQTNYCHMKNGSISVEPGQHITRGTQIGAVGLSGLTEFPHLHFMVRRKMDDAVVSIDPFDNQPLTEACDSVKTPKSWLWDTPIAYQKTALLPPLVSEKRADRTTMWQAQPESVSAQSRVLYFQARGFHVQDGDTWNLQLVAPDGTLFRDHTETQNGTQQRITIALGVTRPSGGFTVGSWQAITRLERGGITIGTQSTAFTVTD